MNNRQPILKKIEQIESDLNKINLYLNQGNRDNCYVQIKEISEKLDSIDSKLAKLSLLLNRGDRDGCFGMINEVKEVLDQTKGYIESEPIVGSELNPN